MKRLLRLSKLGEVCLSVALVFLCIALEVNAQPSWGVSGRVQAFGALDAPPDLEAKNIIQQTNPFGLLQQTTLDQTASVDLQGNGSILQPDVPPVQVNRQATVSASDWITMANGRMGAGAFAAATNDVVCVIDIGYPTVCSGTTAAIANVDLIYRDWIYFAPTTSTVQFLVRQQFFSDVGILIGDGVGVGPPGPAFSQDLYADNLFEFVGSGQISCDICNAFGTGLVSQITNSFGQVAYDHSSVVTAPTGVYFTIVEQLQVQALGGWAYGTAGTFANALDTAGLSIELLTPGASFITGSGSQYNQPITTGAPEPATLALLAIGLAGLGFSRRARKQ